MSKGPLEWSDALRTGDAVIDEHHKTFYLKALRVFVACKLDKGESVLAETLRFMRDYAAFHFAEEEARMRDVTYPYLASHVEAHQAFLGKLGEFERELERADDKRALARATAEFAVRWFRQHIATTDRPLVEYLSAHEPELDGDLAEDPALPAVD